jgi:hypothetical protein
MRRRIAGVSEMNQDNRPDVTAKVQSMAMISINQMRLCSERAAANETCHRMSE